MSGDASALLPEERARERERKQTTKVNCTQTDKVKLTGGRKYS